VSLCANDTVSIKLGYLRKYDTIRHPRYGACTAKWTLISCTKGSAMHRLIGTHHDAGCKVAEGAVVLGESPLVSAQLGNHALVERLALLLHGALGGLEPDLGVRAVTERLRGGTAATTQCDRFPFNAVFVSVNISDRHMSADKVWTVLSHNDGNFLVGHVTIVHP